MQLMKNKTLFFLSLIFLVFFSPSLFSQEQEDSQKITTALQMEEGEESLEGQEQGGEEGEEDVQYVVEEAAPTKRHYVFSFQILDPIIKSLVLVKKFDLLGEQETSRLIIPSFSFESQFEVHRYVSLGIKGSIIPELIANPFFLDNRGGRYYRDPELSYPDGSIQQDNWLHRVYDVEEKYYVNMHFLLDLTVRVLPFGEGLYTLKGFYIKAGGYFGFSVFQNPYMTYAESKSVSPSGEFSSKDIPYFYSREVKETGRGEELYQFVFGVVVGLGWQMTFENGFFLDVGADLTYDNSRKIIHSVPGLGWNGNCAVGYAW